MKTEQTPTTTAAEVLQSMRDDIAYLDGRAGMGRGCHGEA